MFLIGAVLTPSVCLASDPRPLVFMFTVPLLVVSLLAAYAIATKSRTRLGYVALATILLFNSVTGIHLTFFQDGETPVVGAFHLLFPLLFVPAFYVLHKRRQASHHGSRNEV